MKIPKNTHVPVPGYPARYGQPAAAITYQLNGAQVGRGNTLNLVGSGITATPGSDKMTYNISGGGGGSVTGSGTSGQLAFWDAATNISGSTNVTWDDAQQVFTVGNPMITNFVVDNIGTNIIASAEGFIILGDTHGRGYISIRPDDTTRRVTIGDVDSNFNANKAVIDDVTQAMTFATGSFSIQTATVGEAVFNASPGNRSTSQGDVSGNYNDTLWTVDDSGSAITGVLNGSFNIIDTATHPWLQVNTPAKTVFIGDVSGTGNATRVTVQDAIQTITIEAPTIIALFVPTHADDAAAIGAGLVSGTFYKTTTGGSTFLKIVP